MYVHFKIWIANQSEISFIVQLSTRTSVIYGSITKAKD